jgi:hypothetical protein
MKSVTEFAGIILNQALKAQAALVTEGKTPEEIQESLGVTYKLEGDKLKHFVNALEVAGQNQDSLKRVVVASLGEGEKVPAKATKVEEHHYIPEFYVAGSTKQPVKKDSKGGGRPGRGGGNSGGGKESPWGLSPEQKAAKNKGGAAAGGNKPN